MDQDKRYQVAARAFFQCERCGKALGTTGQVAHKIRNSKGTMRFIENFLLQNYNKVLTKKYIQDNIIDNELNVAYTCSLECNSSFNVFFNPVERDKILIKIVEKVI